MLSFVAKRLGSSPVCVRWFRTDAGPPRYRRPKTRPAPGKSPEDKSEWWIIDGEMHEIGENVPPRERFLIPSKNLPNRRRKKLREQFMRRTRLVLKETEHEPWCNYYLELYRELRENWERLYWDEGFSKKIAQDHANYESAEDDDRDFSPYRGRPANQERSPYQNHSFVPQQGDTWQQPNPIRDRFEFDREKRMKEIAFAPMRGGGPASVTRGSHHNQQQNRSQQDQYQQFDVERYFPRD